MRAETQSPPASVEALLRAGVRLLATASDSPRLDAELLLAHTLGCGRAQLFTRRAEMLENAMAGRYLELLAARRRRQPVAQLTGRREFWSMDFAVTPEVLVPRPETELLVERALALLPPAGAPCVLDLGTGSGAVAIAIASERPDCTVTATDLSAAALAVAQRNAAALGCANLHFAAGDWFHAVGDGCFDMIVSNPPYIADHEWAACDPELAFEPRAALAGGADGLAQLRSIVAAAPAHLTPGGWLVVEHGAGQAEAVCALFTQAGLRNVTTGSDLAGLPRVSEGRRP